MGVELAEARAEAVKKLPLIETDKGTAACGEGRFSKVKFLRDAAYFNLFALDKPQNGELPLIVEGAKRTLVTCARYIGKKTDRLTGTGEQEDRMPHEIQDGDCDQERLAQIKASGGPVVEVDGHLEMVNYWALDTNALWNCLFARYVKMTRDFAFRDQIWGAFEASGRWLTKQGLLIQGGNESPEVPRNQWWKDSENSLIDEAGNLPHYPVVPLDVNSWAYLSDLMSAELYSLRGNYETAKFLTARAVQRKQLINQLFWIEDLGVFAPALDAFRRPIRIVTSDVVIALWTGVIAEDKQDQVVRRLMEPDLLTPWGLRTRSRYSTQYNTEAYQNGNVWPHLAGIAAAACERLGRYEEAQVFDAALLHLSQNDFKELFIVDDDNNILPYTEKDPLTGEEREVACRFQAFGLGVILNRGV